MSQEDSSKTVQIFIDLIQRHEQSFYSFVHKVHSKGEGLFGSLMRWIELYLTLIREGLGQPISLEFLLPHTGKERADILREVDEIARYHYKLKLAHEAKLRRRFVRTQGHQDADAEDEEDEENGGRGPFNPAFDPSFNIDELPPAFHEDPIIRNAYIRVFVECKSGYNTAVVPRIHVVSEMCRLSIYGKSWWIETVVRDRQWVVYLDRDRE